MIRLHGEYRMHTILILLQSGVIVLGSFLTGTMLKAMGYVDHLYELPFLVWFVRNWGFMLILIPLFWTLGSIWMDRYFDWYTKRWTLVSGLCLLALLTWFLLRVLARAGSSLISVAE